ncbi:putative sugar transporter [Aureobasidium pullulans]|uniref:Sugar transporter n=3 Tax=Aureobasidium pullulans TaxID=5580 RepID=A0A4V4JJS8_AURPU|nr:putative sugar transporter [Aureobasidium pullulans EXF-150]THV78653.1 putative sugar transporter [Aureobasidium pullulans]KEQ85862.1 putative sugar transporter [Aureobasidium pullulans EXF-150]THW20703.1 putative sugar transporter [Aureobasidium pullulans]THW22550.1 putative sugar transporter [Aureobasidium pullulans]THW51155.1 putative sugar transporter [Aureobasidium pullulans]
MVGFLGMTGKALSIAQIALVVAPSFILFGYNQSGLGPLLSEENWRHQFPLINTVDYTGETKAHHATLQGLIVATFTIGALIGALSCSYTGTLLGRRWVIFIGALCTLIGEAIECSAFELAQLIVGRIIIGLGVGQLSATVPVWQSECSSAKNRGKHVVLDGMFISFGYTLESWIDFGFFTLKTGSVTWRPPIAIALLFSLIVLFSIWFFPESPRWLLAQNRGQEARENLAALKGLPADAPEIEAECVGIEISLEDSSAKAVSFKDLFKMGEDKLAYRFGLCILLQFFQQMSGTNLISVYASTIFQQGLGMSSYNSKLLSAGTLTWKFLSCFVAFFCIDRFGRRLCFMVSGGGMALCMVALAVATSFPHDNYGASVAAAFFVYLFCFFTPIGFLGANFLYCSEISPTKLRVAMASISTANHWLWNFAVAMITPVAINNIGYQYYIVYACIGSCIPVTVYFLYPETKGRSLEELDTIFRDSPSVLGTVKYAKYKPMMAADEVPYSKTNDVHLQEKV